ncbi:transketolase [Gaiella occulta]|uniref:Transketolase n=1 Tax=Gaiella occulta TaxID=1002870 RepID=A0A7M2Z0V8_9ACTN|nr:transketolase [Gaiella occulta]RDI75655.1 transketolase [Gaiella occulta]
MAADPRTETIDTIRALAMDGVQNANAGHPGTAMALAPVAYLLYRDVMRHNPASPGWAGRDRFILSAGHASMLQYAALHLAGYDVTLDDLRDFRQWGSRTPGHPERGHTPGVETTTGPLGQGFANGVGIAIAQRFLAERYNRPGHTIVDSWVYAVCSDGDLMEGVTHEAASIAGHLGLGRLVYVYDDNHITIDGTTSLTFTTEDKGKRFEAYGWHVQHVDDAEDLDLLLGALAAAKAEEERPSLIVLRTHIAYPAPHAIDTSKAHGAPLGEAEVRATKERMGLDPDATFAVSDLVREHMAPVLRRGAELEREWEQRLAAWAAAFPDLARERELDLAGRPRDGWHEALPRFAAGEDVATRDAGKTVMQALKPFTPTMIGGAADLVESTKTEFVGAGIFSATHAGRNVAFGIREHAMGSIVNGIALEPAMLRPYGSTFLIFSDYMRPAVRLSALMGLPVAWVWTHDSIGVGEDGPTHQPIEHHMALRAIPGLWYVRPGDANETAMAWRIALERRDGPVALALSRQKLPTLDRSQVAPAEGALRGAYTLWQRDPASTPEAIVLATGSELHVALAGARALEANVRVVSMPCWELFEEQPAAYREEVLPAGVERRVSIEAGITFGWQRYADTSIGIDHYGASAPAGRIFQELGLTPGAVSAAVEALLR